MSIAWIRCVMNRRFSSLGTVSRNMTILQKYLRSRVLLARLKSASGILRRIGRCSGASWSTQGRFLYEQELAHRSMEPKRYSNRSRKATQDFGLHAAPVHSSHIFSIHLSFQEAMHHYNQHKPLPCDEEDEKFLAHPSLDDEEAGAHDDPSFFLGSSSHSHNQRWLRFLNSPLCLHMALMACYTAAFLGVACLSLWHRSDPPGLIDSRNNPFLPSYSLTFLYEFVLT